jgi:hypothetical protein
MNPLAMVIYGSLVFLCGCVPRVSMQVETRDVGGGVLERGTVTSSDTTSRKFRVDSRGSIVLVISADDSAGLEEITYVGYWDCTNFSGGSSSTSNVAIQGRDPNLPGNHPSSETYSKIVQLACDAVGNGYITGCAKNVKNGSDCTKAATF